jgi:undecaprenyl-phosphate 4-deoxy-4-formamido-L-arabinose transferase
VNAPFLSVIIPVYNEEASLPELIARCLKVCTELFRPFEIILVDDGSRDRSEEIIRKAACDSGGKIIGLILNRNYGQHAAVTAGMAESSGEVVVTLDADLQNPPEEIPKLLERIEDGCDVVGSVRLMRRDSLFRRIGSRIANLAVQRATGVYMRDYGCMLRAYRRPVVDAMLKCNERSTFIPILANSFAGRTAEVEVRHAQREGDRSRYGFLKLVNLQFDLLTSMTTFPLRILSFLGVAMAGVGFLAGLILFVTRVIYGAHWAGGGVFTILAVLFFLVGAQLLGMGLVGEYIGRIYADVRARPRYFIRERVAYVHSVSVGPVRQKIAAVRER